MTALRHGTTPSGAIAADLPVAPARLDVPAGTQILTMTGPCPAEALKPGDQLITWAGALHLVAVSLRSERAVGVFQVTARALGHNRPEDDILLPADVPILLRDWRAQALFGQPQAVVPLHRPADGVYLRPAPATALRMVCLTLPQGAVIYAGGLELPCLSVAAAPLS